MPQLDVRLNRAVASLANFTRPELILQELRGRDAAGIIGELCQLLHREECIPDVLPFYHSALNQELLCNSALECGIALPHARMNGTKRLQFAFGRTPQPPIWGPRGSQPVEFVFLLAVPATDAAQYLHLLASLTRLGQQPQKLAELRAAQSVQETLIVLRDVTVR